MEESISDILIADKDESGSENPKLKSQPYPSLPTRVYKLLGDVKLEFNDSHATYDEGTYKRVLDLDSARVKVEYSANEDFYVREYFALNPDQVLAIRFLEMNRLI
ncbi:Alpha-L-fucosidase 2 [Forsythia ovata]|uniref:Alpha-L-fucosidase 2 n=1 Tax=Forsythia ovata TaxID=205694 RepID=A0ABD1RHU0_9LAMI